MNSWESGLLIGWLSSSWPQSALSLAPWAPWAVYPRPLSLCHTPCWIWRSLCRLCPHLPTTPQNTPAAQRLTHRGESQGAQQGEPLCVGPPFQVATLSLLTSITYNGSMDSPVPLYPTDCPPSYEAVMGLRGDSQVRAGVWGRVDQEPGQGRMQFSGPW